MRGHEKINNSPARKFGYATANEVILRIEGSDTFAV